MRAQASLELLISFLAAILIASLLSSSFSLNYRKMNAKAIAFEEKQSLHSKLTSYYLTGVASKVKCVNATGVTVFNEKVNPFLCSLKQERRWFLK